MGHIASAGADVGKGASLPLQQPRDRFGGSVGQEWGERSFIIAYSEASNAWRAQVPAAEAVHPAADWLRFKSYDFKQSRNSAVSGELVLRYEQDQFSATYPTPGLPEDVVVEDSSVMEIDIRRHPNFAQADPPDADADWPAGAAMVDLYDWRNRQIFSSETVPSQVENELGEIVDAEFAGEAVPESIRGMSSYVVGSGQVTVIEYYYNEPATVLEQSGKRSVPADYDGTTDNWLVLSAVRQREGAFWTRRIVYQFSSKKISGAVYEEASL